MHTRDKGIIIKPMKNVKNGELSVVEASVTCGKLIGLLIIKGPNIAEFSWIESIKSKASTYNGYNKKKK